MRRIAAAVLALALAGSIAGCSSRRIDPEATDSVRIEGTTWYRFCDGPNAVFWVPGRGGDADELEAYVYDHHACAGEFYGDQPAPVERPADDDGISEDEQMACQKDHPTTPSYVRVRSDGRVVCRVCEADRSRRYRTRQKENA